MTYFNFSAQLSKIQKLTVGIAWTIRPRLDGKEAGLGGWLGLDGRVRVCRWAFRLLKNNNCFLNSKGGGILIQ